MTTLYLSRARLRSSHGEALSAVAPLLLPDDAGQRAGHAHRVLWLLFQDHADTVRDFLWRDEDDGRYYVLSQRVPTDPNGLFDLETKPFEPSLEAGDVLRFSLRANPVIATKLALTEQERAQRTRGKRVDVVMHALRDVPKTDWATRSGRAFERDEIAKTAGRDWFARQGQLAGFRVHREAVVTGYHHVAIERRRGKRPAGFSVLDFSGRIEVSEPETFIRKLASGFGSAKAFGCGLMLIRRA